MVNADLYGWRAAVQKRGGTPCSRPRRMLAFAEPARHHRGSNATEGSCAAHKLVGAHCVRPRSWKSNFAFKTLPSARRLATSLDRGRQGLCRCPQRRAGACSRRLVGKVTSPMERHKYFFVDPCALKRLVLSFLLCCTPKTSSRWRSLRMTSLNDICGSAIISSGRRGRRPLHK